MREFVNLYKELIEEQHILNYKKTECKAKELYSKLQTNVPATFKNPETFNPNATTIDLNEDPHKLLYMSSNKEYGNFNPTTVEMPTLFKPKSSDLLKMQNYIVYRDSRMNCEKDKGRYIDKK